MYNIYYIFMMMMIYVVLGTKIDPLARAGENNNKIIIQ